MLNETLISKYVGMKITNAELTDNNNAVTLTFVDGSQLIISDEGQCCCEHRYMTTDDDLHTLIGGQLKSIELKDADTIELESSWEQHDVQFLEISTDQGFVSIVNHNEHNGYYGGFCIELREENAG